MADIMRGVAGGLAGGVAGYVLFFLIARQGFYAIALPGALIGLGCGLLSGRKSIVLGVACALAALILGVVIEWRFAPFIVDKSLMFFLKQLHKLRVATHVLLGIGAVMAFWFGVGREGGVWFMRRGGCGTGR